MLAARPQKITFGEMRDDMGVHGVLVYCADYRCGHSVALSADRWADDIRLSDIEPRFVCAACGKRRSRSFAGLVDCCRAGPHLDRVRERFRPQLTIIPN
jgi:hypothetical protein